MNDALLITLIALTVWRATRLVVTDTLPPALAARRVLAGEDVTVVGPDGAETDKHLPPARWVPDWLAELYGCPWCVSVWVSGGVVGACTAALPGGVPAPWLVWPAAAVVGGWLASRED